MRDRVDVLHAVTTSLSLVLFRGQLQYLRSVGFRPAAMCSDGPFVNEISEQEGVPVYTTPMEREIAPAKDMSSLVRIWRLLRRLRPSICNAGTPKAGLLVMIAARLALVPCRVYTLRGLRLETATGLKRRLLLLTERIACACADRVVCVSPSLRDRAIKLGLVSRERAVVLGSGSSNGIDPSSFSPTPERLAKAAEIRRTLNIQVKARVIGYIGRFTRDKGVPELLQAFATVREHLPNTTLLLIGSYEQGDPVPAETLAAIESAPGVIKIPFQPDIAPYYLAMDIFTLPTHREGFPNTVLEAQAAERPVVTTSATGAVDSVEADVTGLIVPVGNPEKLSEALMQLLVNPALAQCMGRAGRERVEREFRREIVYDALVKLYIELLQSRGLPGPATGRSKESLCAHKA